MSNFLAKLFRKYVAAVLTTQNRILGRFLYFCFWHILFCKAISNRLESIITFYHLNNSWVRLLLFIFTVRVHTFAFSCLRQDKPWTSAELDSNSSCVHAPSLSNPFLLKETRTTFLIANLIISTLPSSPKGMPTIKPLQWLPTAFQIKTKSLAA